MQKEARRYVNGLTEQTVRETLSKMIWETSRNQNLESETSPDLYFIVKAAKEWNDQFPEDW